MPINPVTAAAFRAAWNELLRYRFGGVLRAGGDEVRKAPATVAGGFSRSSLFPKHLLRLNVT